MVEHGGHVAVLVEAGRQAERVGEVDAHHIRFENRVGVVEHRAAQPHERRHLAGDLAEADHLVVGDVGRVVEHEIRLDHMLVCEREQVGGRLVDRVVQTVLRYISHAHHCAIDGAKMHACMHPPRISPASCEFALCERVLGKRRMPTMKTVE